MEQNQPTMNNTVTDVETWYHKWMKDRNKHGVSTINVLDMLKDFAAQQSSPTPIKEVDGELVRLYDEYIKLLGDELDDLVGIAHIHGWRSKRYEQGVDLRSKIETAKAALHSSRWFGIGDIADAFDAGEGFGMHDFIVKNKLSERFAWADEVPQNKEQYLLSKQKLK